MTSCVCGEIEMIKSLCSWISDESSSNRYLDIGDPTLKTGPSLCLQMASILVENEYVEGVNIVRIGVDMPNRRHGICSRIISAVEEVAALNGLLFVRVESVLSEAMDNLMKARKGYTPYGCGRHPVHGWPSDWIQLIKSSG